MRWESMASSGRTRKRGRVAASSGLLPRKQDALRLWDMGIKSSECVCACVHVLGGGVSSGARRWVAG